MAYRSKLPEGILSASKYALRVGLPTSTITEYIRRDGLPAKIVPHGKSIYYEITVAEADTWFQNHPEIVIDFFQEPVRN